MYKEILIATDGSELANRALAHGLKLANEVKARVTIVTVTAPWSALDLAHEARLRKPDPIHQFEEMAAASAKVIFSTLQRRPRKWLALPANSSMFRNSIRLRKLLRPQKKEAAT